MSDQEKNTPSGEVVDESPTIRMSEDKRALLEVKLAQYQERYDRYYDADVEEFIAPEVQFMPGYQRGQWVGALYKLRITKQLLKTGEVDTQELSRKLHREFHVLNTSKLNNACGVILNYCNGNFDDNTTSDSSTESNATVPAEEGISQEVSASAGNTLFMGSGTANPGEAAGQAEITDRDLDELWEEPEGEVIKEVVEEDLTPDEFKTLILSELTAVKDKILKFAIAKTDQEVEEAQSLFIEFHFEDPERIAEIIYLYLMQYPKEDAFVELIESAFIRGDIDESSDAGQLATLEGETSTFMHKLLGLVQDKLIDFANEQNYFQIEFNEAKSIAVLEEMLRKRNDMKNEIQTTEDHDQKLALHRERAAILQAYIENKAELEIFNGRRLEVEGHSLDRSHEYLYVLRLFQAIQDITNTGVDVSERMETLKQVVAKSTKALTAEEAVVEEVTENAGATLAFGSGSFDEGNAAGEIEITDKIIVDDSAVDLVNPPEFSPEEFDRLLADEFKLAKEVIDQISMSTSEQGPEKLTDLSFDLAQLMAVYLLQDVEDFSIINRAYEHLEMGDLKRLAGHFYYRKFKEGLDDYLSSALTNVEQILFNFAKAHGLGDDFATDVDSSEELGGIRTLQLENAMIMKLARQIREAKDLSEILPAEVKNMRNKFTNRADLIIYSS